MFAVAWRKCVPALQKLEVKLAMLWSGPVFATAVGGLTHPGVPRFPTMVSVTTTPLPPIGWRALSASRYFTDTWMFWATPTKPLFGCFSNFSTTLFAVSEPMMFGLQLVGPP